MRRRLSVLACLLMLAPARAAHAAVVEEIAAWVNGKIITRSELLDRERTMVAQLSSRHVGDELDRELERMRGNLLTDMIRETLLLQRAEILGLELDKVYQQALTQLKEQQGIKTNEELDELLRKEGISKDDLRDTLLRFNVPDIMINLEVRDKIAVTEEEITDHYQKNKETYRVEESFTVREIVLTVEGRTPEDLSRLGASVMEELKAGTSFGELVVKYSQAPSRFNEGKIGPFKRGDLAPEIEAAALGLKEGGVSEPIRTRAGLHIVMLESHIMPKDPSLDDARKTITSRIKQEKFTTALGQYFKSLMEDNRIEVSPLYKQYDERS